MYEGLFVYGVGHAHRKTLQRFKALFQVPSSVQCVYLLCAIYNEQINIGMIIYWYCMKSTDIQGDDWYTCPTLQGVPFGGNISERAWMECVTITMLAL